ELRRGATGPGIPPVSRPRRPRIAPLCGKRSVWAQGGKAASVGQVFCPAQRPGRSRCPGTAARQGRQKGKRPGAELRQPLHSEREAAADVKLLLGSATGRHWERSRPCK